MLILLALILAAGLVALCRGALQRHPHRFYLLAAAISLIVGLFDFSRLPGAVQGALPGLLSRGAFATALWIIVMWTGALKNGSRLMKALMPIRGQLSILAAILTLGHNMFYGKTYFVRLFTDAASLPVAQRIAALLSVAMLILLLPLTVTSFPAVRRRMAAKRWKRLQRWAYLYYALLYAHILLVTVPGALSGSSSAVLSAVAYTAIFLSYLCFRVRKHLVLRRGLDAGRTRAVAVAIAALGTLLCAAALLAGSRPAPEPQAEAVGHKGDGVTVSGHAYGYDGEVYVTVTLEDGAITGITGYTEESDDFYFNRCYEQVTEAIIASQSCEVDAVSGATYSSQAIMDAVAYALRQVEE